MPTDAMRPPRLAVIVSRFPKVSETFQLREIVTLERLGVPIELFAITQQDGSELQPDAADLDRRAHYLPRMNLEILRAQLHWLRRDPGAWVDCWRWAWRNFRTAPDFLLRSLVVIPLAATWALRMERLGIEHVHAHYATYPTHAAWVIRHLVGIPYSFTGHAHDLRVRTDGLGDKIADAVYFVTCTRFAMDDLREFFGDVVTDKGVVAYHGVELDVFVPSPPPPPEGRPLRLVCVATFEECKGHRYLLDAVALLRDRGVDVEVDLVGGNKADGFDYRSIMQRHATELGLDDRVTFAGQLTSDEVRRHIAEADLAVLACCRTASGTMDGLPNFLVEAQAMGRAVVTTDLPGPQELIEDGRNGVVVRTRDAASLADGIERLCADADLREAMGAAGRVEVEAHHDVLANTERLFDLLVERAGRPSGHGEAAQGAAGPKGAEASPRNRAQS